VIEGTWKGWGFPKSFHSELNNDLVNRLQPSDQCSDYNILTEGDLHKTWTGQQIQLLKWHFRPGTTLCAIEKSHFWIAIQESLRWIVLEKAK
jgi:hypothetical protein